MNVDWKQAGAALVTGWSHGRPVEAWLAAVQLRVLDLDTLGLARLELTCGLDNVGSRRVAERCGFTRQGLLAYVR